MSEFATNIGLEVHVRLDSERKLFCPCANDAEAEPGTRHCPICAGHPGTMPTVNREALLLGTRLALALRCELRAESRFARKHYFYPDQPKGYQITQHDEPLAVRGRLPLETGEEIEIVRAHWEEDAGKLVHDGEVCLVDLNRAGVPLLEVVTGPTLASPRDARDFATRLAGLARHCGASDARMELGSLRVDANVSVRPADTSALGTRVEIKNVSSFRMLETALEYEVTRQRARLEAGEEIAQETRGWDDGAGRTTVLRTKEEVADYRHLPEPDLAPVRLSEREIAAQRALVPSPPWERAAALVREQGLPAADAEAIVQDPAMLACFDALERELGDARLVAGWLRTELLREANARGTTFAALELDRRELALLLRRRQNGQIPHAAARDVLGRMLAHGESCEAALAASGWDIPATIAEEQALLQLAQDAIAALPDAAERVRAGRENALEALIGHAMRSAAGRASAQELRALLRDLLGTC